jgi:hypothetical protein
MTFPTDCPGCGAPGETNMCTTQIPHFKEVIIMCLDCDKCGYRSNEVKGGGAIPDFGTRVSLTVSGPEDFGREILKSDTAGLAIPELDLELEEGSLDGVYSTVEVRAGGGGGQKRGDRQKRGEQRRAAGCCACPRRCPSAAEAGRRGAASVAVLSEASKKKMALLRRKRAESRAGGGASEASKRKKALLRRKRAESRAVGGRPPEPPLRPARSHMCSLARRGCCCGGSGQNLRLSGGDPPPVKPFARGPQSSLGSCGGLAQTRVGLDSRARTTSR